MESAVMGSAMESASAPARPGRRGEHEGKHGDDEHETERLPGHVAPPLTNLLFSVALVSRHWGFRKPLRAPRRLLSTPGINDRVGASSPGKSFRIEPMEGDGVCVCASIAEESMKARRLQPLITGDYIDESTRHMQ